MLLLLVLHLQTFVGNQLPFIGFTYTEDRQWVSPTDHVIHSDITWSPLIGYWMIMVITHSHLMWVPYSCIALYIIIIAAAIPVCTSATSPGGNQNAEDPAGGKTSSRASSKGWDGWKIQVRVMWATQSAQNVCNTWATSCELYEQYFVDHMSMYHDHK